MMKKIFLFGLMFTMSCQMAPTRQAIKPQHPATPTPPPTAPQGQSSSPVEVAPQVPQVPAPLPKLGIILGPGGLRAYSQVGFIQELVKAKIPVTAIAGVESGALVAALWSHKGQPFDVEWQMFKLKEGDWIRRGLLGQSQTPAKMQDWTAYLDSAFGGDLAEDAKIPFVCSSYNIERSENFLMTRGPWRSLLPFCLADYPFFEPYKASVASLVELSSIAKFLRSKGAEHLLYVDVLGSRGPYLKPIESMDNVRWAGVAQLVRSQLNQVDQVVQIPVPYLIDDFPARRNMLENGIQSGRQFADKFLREHGY